MKNASVVLSVLLLFTGSIWAAPLNRTHVPAEAKWLLHVDLEAFGQSEMWNIISQNMTDKERKKIDALIELLGSDPTRDIYGATLHGTAADPHEAALMVYGKFDKEKLLSLLALNDTFDESEYNGRNLYYWVDEKEDRDNVGMFAADDLIVISQSEWAVKSLADLLDGQGTSLDADPSAPLAEVLDTPQDAFVVMAATELAQLHEGNPHAAILSNSKMIAAVGGEADGQMYARVELTAETEEAAIKMEQVFSGIEAFVTLKHAREPDILSLVQAITRLRNENKLTLSVQYPCVQLYEMIKGPAAEVSFPE